MRTIWSVRAVTLVLLSCTIVLHVEAQVSWVRLSIPGPPAGGYPSLAFDNVRNETVLFGGSRAGGGSSDETWTFNGQTWVRRFPSVSPGPRHAAGMVFDEANGNVVLFSGGNPNTLADTWVWNGSDWLQKTPATSPSLRLGNALVYDRVRRQVVLFGGTGSGAFNDTWIWDGNNWTQRFPSVSPPPATTSSVIGASSDANGNVVMMIGSTAWTWNGTTWTQGTSIPQYPDRVSPVFAYHAGAQRTFLYAGYSAQSQPLFPNDLWAWDGSAWSGVPQTSPNPGGGPGRSIAYDAARNNFVLFGGSNTDNATWQLTVPSNPIGTISVTTSQPTATFTINGPSTYNGNGTNFTANNALIGTYTITFNAINGYLTPPNQTLTLWPGGTITFSGTYARVYIPGSLTITSNHPQASFTITPALPGMPNPIGMEPQGGDTFTRTFPSVPGGAYTIAFNAVPKGGYATPLVAAVVIDGTSSGATGNYLLTDQTVDTDGDAIPDALEWTGTIDGGRSLWSIGARPFKKNVFVEVDWMDCGTSWPVGIAGGCKLGDMHAHRPINLKRVSDSFRDAPVDNPDGTTGILLVIDIGQLGGGGLVPHRDGLGVGGLLDRWTGFDEYKDRYFHSARTRIFRYALFGHYLGSSSGSSGEANGSDFIVSLAGFSEDEFEQSGTFMHELGHVLGLLHGGQDNWNFKPNYLSVMNYHFQFGGLTRNGRAGVFDYSRFDSTALPSLNESALDETVGLNAAVSLPYDTLFYCPDGAIHSSVLVNGPIDWNCRNDIEGLLTESVNVNNGPGSLFGLGSTLNTSNDWSNLRYDRGMVGQGAVRPTGTTVDEATITVANQHRNAAPQISMRVSAKTWQTPTRLALDLVLSVGGDRAAFNLVLSNLIFRTLAGVGVVALAPGPATLPLRYGLIQPGGSQTIRLLLDCPPGVTRFSITENGASENLHHTPFQFSLSQGVLR